MLQPRFRHYSRVLQYVLFTIVATAQATAASNSSPTVDHDMRAYNFPAAVPIQPTSLRSEGCPATPRHHSPLESLPVCPLNPASALNTASATPASYAPTRVPSTSLTRVQVSALGAETTIGEQVGKVTSLRFQQAINCCGLTSVAYALSAIGCPTTADDLLLEIGANSAVDDGMTLAEVHEASVRYIERTGIPAFVECYHFDEGSVTEEDFRTACEADAEAGADDIVVLNFHAGIAHGWVSGGGGHFSVLAALAPGGGDVIMADVHGLKYGPFWATPIAQMMSAMTDRDSSSGRARGALRFGRADRALVRPLRGLRTTVMDWGHPAGRARRDVRRFVGKWDEGLGVRNLAGASGLASAMRVLGGDVAVARVDGVMRALRESYTRQLNEFLGVEEVVSMANRLRGMGLSAAEARVVRVRCDGGGLVEGLRKVGCGREGVVVMVSYDLNEAAGRRVLGEAKGEAAGLCHGGMTWSLVADVDPAAGGVDEEGVVIAPAHNVGLAGRLWTTTPNRLARAMAVLGAGMCRFAVLDAR